MLTAEARLETAQARRHLAQLCRHAGHMLERPLHRGPTGDAEHRSGLRSLEWCDSYAVLRADRGRCSLEATPETLALRVEATDEEALRRLQDLVGGRLEVIGSRDRLRVTWQAPLALTSLGREDSVTSPEPGGRTAGHGLGLPTLLLVVAGALAVAFHLGLIGVGVLAVRQWAGLGADLVLALIALKLAAMAVNVLVLKRFASRLPTHRVPPAAARVLRWVLG